MAELNSTEKKHLPLSDPFYGRLHTFLNSSNSESDRGRTLVAASLIDEMLEEILRGYLLESKETKSLFDTAHSPLSTFSVKANLCRSLGLISKEEYKNIDIVRRIRNEFAHNYLCSYNTQKIATLARTLTYGMNYVDSLPHSHHASVENPRARFSMVCTSLITGLYNRASYVKDHRVKDINWPQ